MVFSLINFVSSPIAERRSVTAAAAVTADWRISYLRAQIIWAPTTPSTWPAPPGRYCATGRGGQRAQIGVQTLATVQLIQSVFDTDPDPSFLFSPALEIHLIFILIQAKVCIYVESYFRIQGLDPWIRINGWFRMDPYILIFILSDSTRSKQQKTLTNVLFNILSSWSMLI